MVGSAHLVLATNDAVAGRDARLKPRTGWRRRSNLVVKRDEARTRRPGHGWVLVDLGVASGLLTHPTVDAARTLHGDGPPCLGDPRPGRGRGARRAMDGKGPRPRHPAPGDRAALLRRP